MWVECDKNSLTVQSSKACALNVTRFPIDMIIRFLKRVWH